MEKDVKRFLEKVEKRNANQPEFMQAVKGISEIIIPFLQTDKTYQNAKLLERLVEPERTIIFRVPWTDDQGEIQVNRGFRIQMNSVLGPYKGGLRFHPTVNLSVLKFLALEQVFKNSLTTLQLGGGKGGSDFDPKKKSDEEVMRFCQSFMTELSRHIGPNTDIPAGDIGVGTREIGYLFGQYKRLQNEFTGILTGKALSYGGSLIRPESTGYGLIYFVQNMLKTKDEKLEGKTILISGSGNVAQFAAEKAIEIGGKVVTLSDSSGYIYDENGIDEKKLAFVKELKNVEHGRIKAYAKKYKNVKYHEGKTPWNEKCDMALPCATQNELDEKDAKKLLSNGCAVIVEGANMPCTAKAIERFQKAKILFAPGKAANAGGVAVSGLEMAQNSMHYSWTADEIDKKLYGMITEIHEACVNHGKDEHGNCNYVKGANIAGFIKIADAMLAQGLV